MLHKHTGNLLRIAAPPGAARFDFVSDRLRDAISNGARAILISLDPDIDSYSRRIVELGGRVLEPGRSDPGASEVRLGYLNCIGLGEGRLESAAIFIEQVELDDPCGVCDAALRPGLLIVEGCQWMCRAPVSGIADRVRHCVRKWAAGGGDLIAIGRNPADTAFLESAPVVNMCSKFREDWVLRAPPRAISTALRELEARVAV